MLPTRANGKYRKRHYFCTVTLSSNNLIQTRNTRELTSSHKHSNDRHTHSNGEVKNFIQLYKVLQNGKKTEP